MAVSKLEKKAWHAYFDHVSEILTGKRAEIEVDSLAIGSQIEAEWLPLLGITYDPKNDMVEILLEGLDHMVRKPREIYVDQDVSGLKSMQLIDNDNVRQIVKLR